MPISFWRRLSTPVKQLITLLILVLLLLLFLVPLSIMATRRVQDCLDSDLYHQAFALRSWFEEENSYLRDEARLLAEFDAFQDLLSSHNETQLRRLMALYQSTHDADGIYLISNSSDVFTSSTSPPLDDDTVLDLELVKMGFNGQSHAEIITIDGKIWLMAVAPHMDSDGVTDTVFLIIREVDSALLETVAGSSNEAIVLTDGEVQVTSHSGEMPDTISTSLAQAVEGQTEEVLQPYTIRFHDAAYRVLVTPLAATHSGSYAIALVKNAEIVTETLWQTLQWGAVVGIIVIAFILLLVHFHIVEIFRPLQALAESTRNIAAGELDEPLQPSGVAEVYDLAISFDLMRMRLKELLERERSLSEDLEAQVQERSQALDEMCRVREHLLAQLISSQEEERRRVSRELHDETSQELASFIVRLGTLSRMTEDEDVLRQLRVLRTQAVNTLEGVNRIVMDLRPGLLDEYGLVPAVQWYADARLESQGVSVQTEVHGTPSELSPYTQASIYRVIQEIINNIAQHAGASEVMFYIEWQDKQLRVEVQDNGRGFDTQMALHNSSGHYGLLGMRERVSLLNGTLDIQSSPGSGTLVIVQIPYALDIARNNGND